MSDDIAVEEVVLSEVGEDVFLEEKVEAWDATEIEVDGTTSLCIGEKFVEVILLTFDEERVLAVL